MLLGFCFAFMSLLTPTNVKHISILTGKHFIFLKNVLDQTWKSFDKKLGTLWKVQKSGYQVAKTNLAHFCNSVTLIFG